MKFKGSKYINSKYLLLTAATEFDPRDVKRYMYGGRPLRHVGFSEYSAFPHISVPLSLTLVPTSDINLICKKMLCYLVDHPAFEFLLKSQRHNMELYHTTLNGINTLCVNILIWVRTSLLISGHVKFKL